MRLLRKFLLAVERLDRNRKGLLLASIDLVVFCAIVGAAYVARISDILLPEMRVLFLLAFAPVCSVVFIALLRGYRSAARYYSSTLELRSVAALAAVAPAWALVVLAAGAEGFPRSIIVIYWAMSVVAFLGFRRILVALHRFAHQISSDRQRRNVIIYGAGVYGVALANSLREENFYRPVAFIDADPTLLRRQVSGLRVFAPDRLHKVTQRSGASELLIADPSLSRAARRELVQAAEKLRLRIKEIPSATEFARADMSHGVSLRPVRIENLLGREPVAPRWELMQAAVTGRVVLITGAGGSIGSELARQIAQLGTKTVVLLDSSEFALFAIHRELTERMGSSSQILVPVLASVLDQELLFRVMKTHGVQTVFHAAAYKHVPLVEQNVGAAIFNNVVGTERLAAAAIEAGVDLFVMISTDKAVRPTSIMGASKRVAELICQAHASAGVGTTFTMVRFGNVLASSGSVVTIFQEQIRSGGPITITHPEVTRYFMSIPEAAQLVLQAAGLADGGEVFLLDMGEPVKILDLARTMVALEGQALRLDDPQGEVGLEIIGLRPGEKLYEELLIDSAATSTGHPRIFRAREPSLTWLELRPLLDLLIDAATGDAPETVRQALDRLTRPQNAGAKSKGKPILFDSQSIPNE